jgi:hypothetical protein
MGAFATYPFYCSTSDKHAFAEINPAPGTGEIILDLQVDPGRTVTGTVVGPDDQPTLDGVTIRTLDVFQSPQDFKGGTFTVTGLPPGRYRLDFVHEGRRLAGSIGLDGGETRAFRAKLQPWGTVVGRIIDEDGRPRDDVELFSTTRERPDPSMGTSTTSRRSMPRAASASRAWYRG